MWRGRTISGSLLRLESTLVRLGLGSGLGGGSFTGSDVDGGREGVRRDFGHCAVGITRRRVLVAGRAQALRSLASTVRKRVSNPE
jgi:hypothetical protein